MSPNKIYYEKTHGISSTGLNISDCPKHCDCAHGGVCKYYIGPISPIGDLPSRFLWCELLQQGSRTHLSSNVGSVCGLTAA